MNCTTFCAPPPNWTHPNESSRCSHPKCRSVLGIGRHWNPTYQKIDPDFIFKNDSLLQILRKNSTQELNAYLCPPVVLVLFALLCFKLQKLLDEVERHEALAEHEDLVANQFALAEDVHEQNQLAAVLDLHHVVIVDELRPPGTRQGRSDPQFFLGRRPFSTTGTSTRFPAIDRLGFFFIC